MGGDTTTLVKKRAPTLYVIIVIKLFKGILLLLLGLGVYSLSDNNLPDEFRHLLEFFHLDPEKKFFSDLAERIANITPTDVVHIAIVTVLYGLICMVEGVGLIFRIRWIGWMTIVESAFFIPIELYELVEHFKWVVLVILGLNVLIVWYLFQNRRRLFRHHHH